MESRVNILGRRHRHGNRLQVWQVGGERFPALVVPALAGPEERVPERRTNFRKLQVVDGWLINNLSDVCL